MLICLRKNKGVSSLHQVSKVILEICFQNNRIMAGSEVDISHCQESANDQGEHQVQVRHAFRN